MSTVWFFDYSKEGHILRGIERLLDKSGILEMIPRGSSVAVKLHMGELGNITYLRPVFVRKVVDLVKKRGASPFITDTVSLYPGNRDTKNKYLSTAAFNGFVRGGIGVPIVIADGDGDEGRAVAITGVVRGCGLGEVEVAARIYDADFLLVLSHVKGHLITGFGGAVKNLGMGCVTKRSKKEQHQVCPPILDPSKCDVCGRCVDVCPTSSLSIDEGEEMLERDWDKCLFCNTCLFACNRKAFSWERAGKERLQVYLAHAAAAVARLFKGKMAFLNFIQDVTPCCDCAAPAGRTLFPDIGIMASIDPVAIDKASLDLIDKAPMVGECSSILAPDKLGKLHQVDSLVQLRVAEELQLGSLGYNMKSL